MKKNITVNIFGTLYPIDEDAYELLQRYNENMRRYYSRREGGEEIADDVEHRVAELLSEYRSKGVMAITIEHVKEIIDRIGDPQQMDAEAMGDEAGGGSTPPPFDNQTDGQQGPNGQTPPPPPGYDPAYNAGDNTLSRKVFRDPDDRILGGVLSGLSHYFGISDPLVLRVIFIVLLFISFSVAAIIYLIAWVLIPEAVTPEDRLRMYGKPVTAKTLNEELMRGMKGANEFVNNPNTRDNARGCLSALAKIVLLIIGGFFALILGSILISLLIALIAAVFGLSIAAIFGDLAPINIAGAEIHISQLLESIPTSLTILGIISTLLVIGLPLYGLIRLLVNRSNEHNLSTAVKASLIAIWLLSAGAMIGSFIAIGHKIASEAVKIEQRQNTHNGIYMPRYTWRVLDRMGWTAEQLEGTDRWIEDDGILPNGEMGSFISLEAKNNPNNMHYDLRKTLNLQPGTYKIEGWARADGEGNALYVVSNNNRDTLRVAVPKFEKVNNPTDTTEVVLYSNDGSRDWSHVEGEFVVSKPSTVSYGITNKSAFNTTPWNSHKVSIGEVSIVTK